MCVSVTFAVSQRGDMDPGPRPIVLMVGASRLAGLQLSDQRFEVVVKSSPGAPLKKVVEETDAYLKSNPNVKIVVVVALQCDLGERKPYIENGRKGLVTALTEPRFDKIMNIISYHHYAWYHAYGVSTFWTVPYRTDMLAFNQKLARRHNMGPLCKTMVLDSHWTSRTLRESAIKMLELLQEKHIPCIDLEEYKPVLTRSAGGDGLHMGPGEQKKLFTQVFERVLREHPTPAPSFSGMPHTLAEREAIRLKLHKKRARNAILKKTGVKAVQPADKPHVKTRLTHQFKKPKQRKNKVKGAAHIPVMSQTEAASSAPSGVPATSDMASGSPGCSYAPIQAIESTVSTAPTQISHESQPAPAFEENTQYYKGYEFENEYCYKYANSYPPEDDATSTCSWAPQISYGTSYHEYNQPTYSGWHYNSQDSQWAGEASHTRGESSDQHAATAASTSAGHQDPYYGYGDGYDYRSSYY